MQHHLKFIQAVVSCPNPAWIRSERINFSSNIDYLDIFRDGFMGMPQVEDMRWESDATYFKKARIVLRLGIEE